MAANTSIIIRLEIDKMKVSFGDIAAAISDAKGDVVAIDVIHSSKDLTVRDITVDISGVDYDHIIKRLNQLSGVHIVNISVKNRDDLSKVYTPGVARVCMAIHENKSKAYSLTIKRNTVAVVSDGTAVLGLGDIGPEAAMPVMEGKAMLFKQLAGVDAFPLCLDIKDTEEIIRTIKAIAPTFGGINLEDISSPRCFEIEERLREELNIPVFHDDQHGTAVVMLAGLFNALKVIGKSIDSIRVVVVGVGAAGVACCKMLIAAGVQDLIAVDRSGAIVKGITYENPMWNWLAEHSNPTGRTGLLSEVIVGADVFVGVSGPGVLKVEDIQNMAADPIVFAMANPEPEIDPELAEPFVRVLATGRSDYPNQINNVLVFPGIFRGALDCQAKTINEEMKLAAARAIASVVTEDELNEQYIIPSIFNEKVVQYVRNEVIRAAISTDVARRIPKDFR
jgi:malate dehydrogenase (oxaloacetate-decarboxylating)